MYAHYKYKTNQVNNYMCNSPITQLIPLCTDGNFKGNNTVQLPIWIHYRKHCYLLHVRV